MAKLPLISVSALTVDVFRDRPDVAIPYRFECRLLLPGHSRLAREAAAFGRISDLEEKIPD